MSKKRSTAKPAPNQGHSESVIAFLIRNLTPEGLEVFRDIVLRCPLPGSAEIAEKLQAGLRSRSCGTRAKARP